MAKTARRLTRDHIRIPEDTNETVADLTRKLRRGGTGGTLRGKRGVRRVSIRVAERVFQWRIDKRNIDQRQSHILKMAKSVLDTGEPLEPITVLPVGAEFYVVDGHHRLAAYDTAKWVRSIPTTVFAGTLQQAREHALTQNSRDKLSMSDTDKYEAAWRMTLDRHFDGQQRSIPETAKKANVSTSTVSNMRRALNELARSFKAKGCDFPRDITWRRARMESSGDEIKYDDDWLEGEAQKLVEALRKANIYLAKNVEITALALRMIFDGLPQGLISEWFVEEREFIDQLIEERSKPLRF